VILILFSISPGARLASSFAVMSRASDKPHLGA
jgi:hypothetical protein